MKYWFLSPGLKKRLTVSASNREEARAKFKAVLSEHFEIFFDEMNYEILSDAVMSGEKRDPVLEMFESVEVFNAESRRDR